VRRLAQDLGLAVNTIARAYRELETEGLVEARGRSGTSVAWSRDEAHRALEQAAASFAQRANALGLSSREARTLIDRALGLS
jgi:DNA-binding transcriptional regulator YhcF (GntR family)